ncbi:MAG TPA: DUF3322 domain-containing protein [Tepidisphaeraceae bacterium]|jgi:hypothetical protein|nr:DUF3322 domain-containing protein [Tepidisphaeraceae bacterium]
MLTPEQIHRRALNRYTDFLRSLCTGECFFPLAVFGAGMARPKDFSTDRAAIDKLRRQSKEQTGFGYEIAWERRNFRRLGLQNVPSAVAFPSAEDYVRFLKRQAEVRQFQADYELVRKQCPELGAWAQANPTKVVDHAGSWQGLLDVCAHLQNHPRPNCYLRELPVVVDTKFIEGRKGVLSELLPIVAPLTFAPDKDPFEARFGFRSKQPLIRMRFLDEQLQALLGFPVDDFATPLDKFCGLPLSGNTVLIVENEMTFLTLPKLLGTLAIWGAGDAAALLANVGWLRLCRVFYWGDLDCHGFEALSNLRKSFPHVASILMDEGTFADHASYAVKASGTRTKERLELTSIEQVLYNQLVKTDALLEQERVPDAYSRRRLSQFFPHPESFSQERGKGEASN